MCGPPFGGSGYVYVYVQEARNIERRWYPDSDPERDYACRQALFFSGGIAVGTF